MKNSKETTIVFNYKPELAVKAIKHMANECAKDPATTQMQRKVFEDIVTLVELGVKSLAPQPTTVPTDSAKTKN